ncbi:hypothetical protein DITRI_Ditri04bG0136900 [Diplodiscus trichospermus]
MDLEKGAFEALIEGGRGLPAVYPVGPLVQTSPANEVEERSKNCLRWLDKQLSGGFLEKTKEVGLMVPSWAPQIQVFSHGSTEQKMNAVLLKDGLKVAFRANENGNGLVG